MKLGDRVKDVHSEVEGVVYMIETCLFREPRIQVLRDGVDSYGNLWAETWFFEGRLKKL